MNQEEQIQARQALDKEFIKPAGMFINRFMLVNLEYLSVCILINLYLLELIPFFLIFLNLVLFDTLLLVYGIREKTCEAVIKGFLITLEPIIIYVLVKSHQQLITTIIASALIWAFELNSYHQSTTDSTRLITGFLTIKRSMILFSQLFIYTYCDGILTIDLKWLFWILYFQLILLFGIAFTLLLMSFGKLLTYYNQDETDKAEVQTMFYLTFTAINNSIILTVLIRTIQEYINSGLTGSISLLLYQLIYTLSFMTISALSRNMLLYQIENILYEDEPANLETKTVTSPGVPSDHPKVLQKISKTYFGIPVKQNRKVHRKSASSYNASSQIFIALDCPSKTPHKEILPQSQSVRLDTNINHEQQSIKLDQSTNVCLICYDKPPDSVLMECGHGGLCNRCALDLCQTKKECYLCRQLITNILKVNLDEKDGNLVKVIGCTPI